MTNSVDAKQTERAKLSRQIHDANNKKQVELTKVEMAARKKAREKV
ncbi:MAG: hypothetical protein V3V74_07560 [Nitrosomonadaceae bacterium]